MVDFGCMSLAAYPIQAHKIPPFSKHPDENRKSSTSSFEENLLI